MEGLQQASVDATVMKKQKLTYNFVAALDINFPKHNRGMVASSLVETISCESQNKNRFYLTPINESFIIEPDHGRISIRDVQTLAEVRAILLKTNNNMDISACRMIPGRSNAIAGD